MKSQFKSYTLFQDCVKNNGTCECSCFTALPLVDDNCTKFNDMESSTKAAKKKCTSPTEKGSFGDCRQQERKVAYYGEKCKKCTASMTTKVGFRKCKATELVPSLISGSKCCCKIFEAKTVSENCWEEVETIVRSILVQRFKNNKVVVV